MVVDSGMIENSQGRAESVMLMENFDNEEVTGTRQSSQMRGRILKNNYSRTEGRIEGGVAKDPLKNVLDHFRKSHFRTESKNPRENNVLWIPPRKPSPLHPKDAFTLANKTLTNKRNE